MIYKFLQVVGLVTIILLVYNAGIELVLKSFNNTARLKNVISMSDFKFKRRRKHDK